MYVLVVVFNKPECLREILRKMKSIGITGATIIDTVGAGKLKRSIGKEVPLIGSVMKSLDTDIANNKTLFTLIEKKETLDTIMDEIEKICGGDMSQPGTGVMFAVPVITSRGGSISRVKDNSNNVEK